MSDEQRENFLDMVTGFNARCEAMEESIAASRKRIRQFRGDEAMPMKVDDYKMENSGLKKENSDLKKQNENLLAENYEQLRTIGDLKRAAERMEQSKKQPPPQSSIFGPNYATGMPRGLGGAGVQPAEVLLQKDLDELREKYRVLELSMQGMVYYENQVEKVRTENFELKLAKSASDHKAEKLEKECGELKEEIRRLKEEMMKEKDDNEEEF